jgi:methylase of polypeptide subunit release factors
VLIYDPQEELNRLDIFHKVFLLARDNQPLQVKLERKAPRIMDIGTGTGIWAINVAEESVFSIYSYLGYPLT